jgi:hypothetical protein
MHDYFGFIVIVIIVILMIIYQFIASNRRRKELADWALSKNLFFFGTTDGSFDSRYPGFDCLQKGHSRYAHNIMKGNFIDHEFIGCDYHYTTGSGRSSHEYNFSLVILKSPIVLQKLVIRPETFSDKLAELIGFDDINFESAEFSKKFYVKSPDKKWAYDIIHPQMMEFLMNSPVFSIQFDLMYVIAYRDTRFSTAEFEDAANLAKGIFDRIPDYVIQNQKTRFV